MICQSPAQSLWFFRQYREERSCHARFPSGWKDSFQTNRLHHAPSTLRQPQRTSTGCLLHYSMWDPHTTLHSNTHAICTMQYVALALVCPIGWHTTISAVCILCTGFEFSACMEYLNNLLHLSAFAVCSVQFAVCNAQKWFQTYLMRLFDNYVAY